VSGTEKDRSECTGLENKLLGLVVDLIQTRFPLGRGVTEAQGVPGGRGGFEASAPGRWFVEQMLIGLRQVALVTSKQGGV